MLVALTCLRQAQRNDVDVVILASRDTDLVPVLDTLLDMRHEDPAVAKIETATWYNRTHRNRGSLQPTSGRRIWNTPMDRACFEASLDRNDYR